LFRRPVDGERITTVPVEITGQGNITRVAEEEPDIGDPLCVRVSQIGESVRGAEQSGSVDTVTIPIPHERHITRIAIDELRDLTSLIPQIPHARSRIDQTHGVGRLGSRGDRERKRQQDRGNPQPRRPTAGTHPPSNRRLLRPIEHVASSEGRDIREDGRQPGSSARKLELDGVKSS
jgi:hypothetical protein